jgi:hypothetical protein
MSWKLEFTLLIPAQDEDERCRQDKPHSAGVTAAILAAAIIILYAQAGPELAPLPSDLAFGSHPVQAASSEHLIVVRNVGSSALTISHIGLDGHDAQDFKLTNQSCANTPTRPNEVCQVGVLFIPQAGGERHADLVLVDDARSSPQKIALSGNGIARADLSVEPGRVDFGDQTISAVGASQQISLRNIGSAPLSIAGITVIGDQNDFSIETGNCIQTTIAAGRTCILSVRFSPKTPGIRTLRLLITDTTGDPQHTAVVSGIGTTAPVATARLDPNALEFGQLELGNGSRRIVTITNVGTAPLQIADIDVTGEGASEFVSNNACSHGTFAPGAGCELEVRFTPLAVGNHFATLTVADNASDSPQQVQMSGVAVPRPSPNPSPSPMLMIHPTQLSFRDQEVKSTSPAQRVTLTSGGSAPARLTKFYVEGKSNKDFSVTDVGCSDKSLTPREACSLDVMFAPKPVFWSHYPAERKALLIITDQSSNRHEIGLIGTAILSYRQQDPSQFVLSPSQLDFGIVQVGARSERKSVTVSNAGSVPLNLSTSILDNAFLGLFTGSNQGHFQILSTNCQSTPISPGAQCTVLIMFTPKMGGDVQADLVVRGSASQQQAAHLTGTGGGWCCLNGSVSQTTPDVCGKQRGVYYPDEQGARRACIPIVQ